MEAVAVVRVVSSKDEMWGGDATHYFDVGADVLRHVRPLTVTPQRILDLPCGHGRVLRWLRAEWPQAEITACDLNRHGVDFCARELDARPLYSEVEPERIPLEGNYDLIWCGSLFTHLDEPMWGPFLRLFAKHLEGTLVFTTAGERIAALMRDGELAEQCDATSLLASYDASGFGYANYHGQASYGLSRAKPSWVRSLLESVPLETVYFEPAGWADRQDVWGVRAPSSRGGPFKA
jgi:SAM-dependent methyltransferase